MDDLVEWTQVKSMHAEVLKAMERCAKIAENFSSENGEGDGFAIATEIRDIAKDYRRSNV